MIFRQVKREQRPLARQSFVQLVQRNFGGYYADLNPSLVFLETLFPDFVEEELISSQQLINRALDVPDNPTETRYLLLLTKNNAALRIIEEQGLVDKNKKVSIIYGSSFPHDQEYTQICRNINRIKIAMETGETIILCNLENLYESLYDALNQSYMYLGDSRYVDLGLGNQRVKCRVHPDFRMIVVADEKDVREKFPIPLINRLEKHFLGKLFL